MKVREMLDAAANIGFGIATMEAFMRQPGVSPKQVQEAIQRLNETLDMWSTYAPTSDAAASNASTEESK